MTTFWTIMLTWVALDVAFVCGCWWAGRDRKKLIWICGSYRELLDQSLAREVEALNLLEGTVKMLSDGESDERFDWRAGTGVP